MSRYRDVLDQWLLAAQFIGVSKKQRVFKCGVTTIRGWKWSWVRESSAKYTDIYMYIRDRAISFWLWQLYYCDCCYGACYSMVAVTSESQGLSSKCSTVRVQGRCRGSEGNFPPRLKSLAVAPWYSSKGPIRQLFAMLMATIWPRMVNQLPNTPSKDIRQLFSKTLHWMSNSSCENWVKSANVCCFAFLC